MQTCPGDGAFRLRLLDARPGLYRNRIRTESSCRRTVIGWGDERLSSSSGEMAGAPDVASTAAVA